MAVTEQRQLFAPQVESLAEQYAKSMGTVAADPFTTADITAMAPQVAPQTALQTRLEGDVTAGLGAYQPYVQAAGTQLGLAGTGLAGAETGLAGLGAAYADPAVAGLGQAQTTLGGVSPYISAAGTGLAGAGTAMAGVSPYITGAAGLTGAGAGTGAGSIAEYMSPYQSQVIDTTLEEFDRQAAMRQQAISDAAVGVGGFGGGREGVMQAEYQTQSDRNRAMIEAQLQQQGFTQAQAARQADMAARLGIGGAQQQYAQGLAGLGQAQLGLGGAQQALAGQQAGMAGQRAGLGQAQLGLGQYQTGLGQALQGMTGQDIGTMGRVGALDQAQAQAVADAQREAQRMAAYEPMERWGYLGQGIAGMLAGYPAQYQSQIQPNASPLATALGIASTAGGIYGNIYGPQRPSTVINTK